MDYNEDLRSLLENSEESRQSYGEFTWRIGRMDAIEVRGIKFILNPEERKAIAPNGVKIDFSELYGISNGSITNFEDYTQTREVDDLWNEPLDF